MDQEIYAFGATLSRMDKIITRIVGYGAIMGIPFTIGISFAFSFRDARFLLLPLVALSLFWYLYRWRVRQFSLARETITIERGVGDVIIPIARIQKISRLAAWPRGITLRLFGIGGFYGSQGIFWNKTFGRFYLYLTDSKHMIEIIEKNGRRTIISPDTPEQFLDIITKIKTEHHLDFELIR